MTTGTYTFNISGGRKVIFTLGVFGRDCGTKVLSNGFIYSDNKKLTKDDKKIIEGVIRAIFCYPDNKKERRKLVSGFLNDTKLYQTKQIVSCLPGMKYIKSVDAHCGREYRYAVVVVDPTPLEGFNCEFSLRGSTIKRVIKNGRIVDK